ncbi:MAG: DUF1080 domain-containing protein [Puniceicoccaceae bacterium]
MRLLIVLLILVFPLTLFAGKWQNLIKGDSLSNWMCDPDYGHWSVQGGVITGKSDPEKNGSALYTREEFEDFIFETEFKYKDFIDSGILLKRGIQVNLGNSISERVNRTGSIYAPQDGKGKYPAIAENAHEIMVPNGWNHIRVQCKGKTITVTLNGREVVNYTTENLPDKGQIGIQVHSNLDMKIQFRNIRILRI